MSIRFRCPSGHKLAAPEERAGRRARCPKCKQVVTIPGVSVVANEPTAEEPPKGKAIETRAKSSTKPEPEPPTPSHVAASKPKRRDKPDKNPQNMPDEKPRSKSQSKSESKPQTKLSKKTPSKKTPNREVKSSVKPPPLKRLAGRTKVPPAIPSAADRRAPSEPPKKPPGRPKSEPQSKSTAEPTPPAPRREAVSANSQADLAATHSRTDTPEEFRNDASFWARWISTDPGYRPERLRVQTVRWLAAALAMLTGLCLWPALANIASFGDRLWVSAVIFLSALQLAYIIWMVSIPDWSTLRVMMGVFTCVAAAYGMGMALAFFSDPGDSTVLQFSDEKDRATATLWCGLVVILSGLMVYLLGRCDTSWRRAFWLSGGSRR